MGYTTQFEGEFRITPALEEDEVNALNDFTEDRHDDPNMPGIWCDWVFNNDDTIDDGPHTVMCWNGSEKSYEMTAWANYLKKNFFPKRDVRGSMRARGESFDDVWTMVTDGVTFSEESRWK